MSKQLKSDKSAFSEIGTITVLNTQTALPVNITREDTSAGNPRNFYRIKFSNFKLCLISNLTDSPNKNLLFHPSDNRSSPLITGVSKISYLWKK